MVTAPVTILLIDRVVCFHSFADAFRRRWRFYAGLAMTWLVLAVLMASSPRANSAGFFIREDAAGSITYGGYLLNQAEIVVHYLRLMVVPTGLVLDYGPPRMRTVSDTMPHILVLSVMVVIAAMLWRRKPVLALPLILLFLTLAPTGLVPVITEVGAERRMYLPGIALITAAVVTLSRVGLRGRAATVVCSVVIAVLLSLTIARASEYRSSYGMWQKVVERRPHGRAYLNLAVEAEAIGRRDDVLPLLRRAVEDLPDAEYPLGERLYQAGAYQEAIEHLERFLMMRPGHHQANAAKRLLIQSWTDLGIARATAGDLRQAIDAFQRSLALDPSNADLRRNLATALADAQRSR